MKLIFKKLDVAEDLHPESTILMMKHGDDSIMVWERFSKAGQILQIHLTNKKIPFISLTVSLSEIHYID